MITNYFCCGSNLILSHLARVMCLLREHMPHAPLGILNITLIAGNDVNVRMENTLPGCSSHVNANIVAVGIELQV